MSPGNTFIWGSKVKVLMHKNGVGVVYLPLRLLLVDSCVHVHLLELCEYRQGKLHLMHNFCAIYRDIFAHVSYCCYASKMSSRYLHLSLSNLRISRFRRTNPDDRFTVLQTLFLVE